MADKITERIGDLQDFDTVDQLIKFGIGRCHALSGSRRGEFAMDLVHPFRLVFEKKENVIELVRINSIEDYH